MTLRPSLTALIVSATLSAAAIAEEPTDSTSEATASDDQRIADLEDNMQQLDSKLDQLLLLLSANTETPASTDQGESPDMASNVEEEPLEESTLPTFDETQALLDELDETIDIPTKQGLLMDVMVIDNPSDKLPTDVAGMLVSTLNYQKGGEFTFSEHYKDPDISSFAFNSTLGVNYRGFLKIGEQGTYVFTTNLSAKGGVGDGGREKGRCNAAVTIDNSLYKGSWVHPNKEISISEQAFANLSPGFVPIQVWITCHSTRNNSSYSQARKREQWDNIRYAIRVKGPSDNKLRLISKSELFHY